MKILVLFVFDPLVIMPARPFFSIIIPTRNEAKRLAYCLPSLLGQDFESFEIIIVDDPETSDETVKFVEGLRDKRLHYLRHKAGLRVPAKRNLGAREARGQYLYFIDADMEFPAGVLSSLAAQLKAEKISVLFVAERTPGAEWVARMKDLEKQIIQREVTLIAARLYRRTLFKKLGGYKENLVVNEEVELSDRALTQGYPYGFSQVSVNHYETSGQSLLPHLRKKFKYGTTAADYFAQTEETEEMAEKRAGTSRLVYFTSPRTWQNPLLGLQFVTFKTLEIGSMILGLLYAKIKPTRTVTTK